MNSITSTIQSAIEPPIILPGSDPRIGISHIDPADICHESHIVWLIDPADLPYVREEMAIRCSRTARIGSAADTNLLGYSVLRRDAPPTRGCRGCWWRRVFRIARPYDHDIVDPATIDTRVPGMVTERMLRGLAE